MTFLCHRAANSWPSTFLPRPGQPQGSASQPAPQGCAAPSPGPSLEPVWTGKHLKGRGQTPEGWRASTWREEGSRRLAPLACAAPLWNLPLASSAAPETPSSPYTSGSLAGGSSARSYSLRQRLSTEISLNPISVLQCICHVLLLVLCGYLLRMFSTYYQYKVRVNKQREKGLIFLVKMDTLSTVFLHHCLSPFLTPPVIIQSAFLISFVLQSGRTKPPYCQKLPGTDQNQGRWKVTQHSALGS